uniref:MHD domain-containing protein n=1 Tax=Arcella intermedia TaxID=1963864 RepID=A0A6B2L449_9EUKA
MRGDTLIFRDFRNDVGRWTTDLFFRRATVPVEGEGDEPIFNVEGTQFIFTKKNGMYFVFASRHNVSPALSIELLERIAAVIKDYCGVLTEEAIRKNFILVYELVDEIVDFGYPQSSSSEDLKAFVRSVPVLVDTEKRSEFLTTVVRQKTTSSKTANQSVTNKEQKKKDEIFVDLLERITVHFGSSGQLSLAEIEGAIVIKSFIKGKPKLKLGLNEELIIGRNPDQMNYGKLCLDYCNFHECCQFSEWDIDRTLVFYPPDGEFALIKYKCSEAFEPPFKIFSYLEDPGPSQLDVIIRVSSEFPPELNANKVHLICKLPRSTVSASCELDPPETGTYEFDNRSKAITWNLGKIKGAFSATIRIKLNLEDSVGNYKREVGPIGMDFEIPMYRSSQMQIRYLKAMENEKELKPYRWVRSITKAESYVARVDSAFSSTPRYN